MSPSQGSKEILSTAVLDAGPCRRPPSAGSSRAREHLSNAVQSGLIRLQYTT